MATNNPILTDSKRGIKGKIMEVDLFGNPTKDRKVTYRPIKRIKYKAKIALWSGGKDSTTMVDRLLRDGKELDYIIFSDTQKEFKEMYEYINKVKNYWFQRYNKKVITLHPHMTFDDMIFNVRGENGRPCINQDNYGKISGLLNPSSNFCEWRRISKIRPYERWLRAKGFKEDEVLIYVGFSLDEPQRLKRHKHEHYPLVDTYRMRENDCKKYLENMEMENPLYRFFSRTGCRLCPYQSENDFYTIWRYFPNVWHEYIEYERSVKEHKKEAISNTWFINHTTCEKMEEKFKRWQFLEFEPNREPLKNCFCKI